MEKPISERKRMGDVACKKCGKQFLPAPYHAYVDAHKYYCSWTCYNHRNDGKEKRSSKKVWQYNRKQELIGEYSSATEAAKGYCLNPSEVQRACREGKMCGGYYWRYKDED